jgi:hypothetical protein
VQPEISYSRTGQSWFMKRRSIARGKGIEVRGGTRSRIASVAFPTVLVMPVPLFAESSLAAPPAGSGLKPILGDDGAPLVGHSLVFMRFGVEYALHRYDTYGPVSWMGAFVRRIVDLSGPEATQVALVNKDKAFSQDGWKFFIENFFPRGLMLLDFGERHAHRRIMQQAFTRERLTGYVGQTGPPCGKG